VLQRKNEGLGKKPIGKGGSNKTLEGPWGRGSKVIPKRENSEDLEIKN